MAGVFLEVRDPLGRPGPRLGLPSVSGWVPDDLLSAAAVAL